MASKAGGGIKSKNVVRPGVRNGSNAKIGNPKGVSQIGTNRANHATDRRANLTRDQEPLYRGINPNGGVGAIPLGNAVAKNVGGGGPGVGYNKFGQCGSQGTYNDRQELPTKTDNPNSRTY